MKLYVTTVPYLKGWDEIKPVFHPVGTTFAAIGFDNCGVFMQAVEEINQGEKCNFSQMSINPELIKICFKEVEQLNSQK